MMSSPGTLHDFVLNLLSDPALKAAFAADAQGCLEQAGLADITAVDVQEVIPLVLDLVPDIDGLPAVDGVDLDLPADELLADGPLGAISQLQAVASQLTSSGLSLSDIHTSSAGVLAADGNGLNIIAANRTLGEYTSTNIGLDGDFSAVGDVASVLDQTTSPLTGSVLDVADTGVSTIDSAALDTVSSVVPGTDSVVGHLGGVTGLADGLLGTVGGGDAGLGNVLGVSGLDDLSHGALNVHSTETVVSAQGVAGSVVGTATGVAHSATGLAGDTAGVGNVLGGVTDTVGQVTHGVPVVGDLGLDGLLG
ncbi:IniB N-terminal domain-containing protein [Lentzea chajnantorensis]